MAVIELDPRFPQVIPLSAAHLLAGEVCYTEEVPIRVRWAIADAGGHSVSHADVLVTTDRLNEEVQSRLRAGEEHITTGLAELDDETATATPVVEAVPIVEEAEEVPEVAPAEPQPEPEAPTPVAPHLDEAIEIMARARAMGQWEAQQTHASLLPYLIEEVYEFVDAVNEGSDILGELSDLLLQILFHAEVAEDFDIDDVAAAFVMKMRSRQPYLFDGSVAEGEQMSIDDQERLWAAGRGGPRSEPALQLPALALAEEAIRRARSMGIPDSEIPVDLKVPNPALELEGGAEARTRKVARQYLAELAALQPESDD